MNRYWCRYRRVKGDQRYQGDRGPLPGAHRPGTTLIELLLFTAILVIVSVSVIPILFYATEDRLLQQTASVVEQNGTQLLQTIAYRVRHAERIISPSPGTAGSVLVLQTSSGATNPTIIGISTGAMLFIHHTIQETLSSTQVAVEDLEFRNTSTSATRQSVQVTFRLSRTIRLQSPRSYSRQFEAVFTVFPDDDLHEEDCVCAVPGCAGDYYAWQVCEEAQCLTAQTELECP